MSRRVVSVLLVNSLLGLLQSQAWSTGQRCPAEPITAERLSAAQHEGSSTFLHSVDRQVSHQQAVMVWRPCAEIGEGALSPSNLRAHFHAAFLWIMLSHSCCSVSWLSCSTVKDKGCGRIC